MLFVGIFYDIIIEKIFNDETGMFVTKKYEDDKEAYQNTVLKDIIIEKHLFIFVKKENEEYGNCRIYRCFKIR